ncbi:MAG: tetratricopeptide repeat protein [Acidobacteriota bacterium]
MSADIQETDRHIFPRWRSFKATSDLGELSLASVEVDSDTSELDLSLSRGIANWKSDPSLWRGLDLLGTAIVAGKLESFSALVEQVKRNPLAPKVARELLDRTQKTEPAQLYFPEEYDKIPDLIARREIRSHRLRLISAPRDAIEWVELARFYTIVGSNKKAARAIRAALHLAPNNRFVLRSAARFFIHTGEKEYAHNLLSTAPSIGRDPWILASEIAIADSLGRASKFSRIAMRKMEMDIPASELTELASAVGSIEAENGNHRGARRLLRQALMGANENSIAQIRWLNRAHLGDAIDVSHSKPPLLHEANAWASFYRGDFETARDESLGWLKDQPFASAPASLSSYILSDVLGNFADARLIAQAGLRANPDDPTLLNNLAVCLMELGELDEAETILSRLEAKGDDKRLSAIHKATFGMLAFRKGNPEDGRKLYLEAIRYAESANAKQTAARAAIHLLLEEYIAKTAHVEEALNRLRDFRDLMGIREISRLLSRVQNRMQHA